MSRKEFDDVTMSYVLLPNSWLVLIGCILTCLKLTCLRMFLIG